MIVWLDEARKIIARNDLISKDEATQYLCDSCLWIENLEINPPSVSENQIVQSYLKDDMSTRYEIIDVVTEISEQEVVNTEILLNQVTQDARLTEIDETLAVILLNSTGGALNV